jgi:uncharacterized protein with PIN domain
VTERTIPEVCEDCGGDMALEDTEREDATGKFEETWYCERCDKYGTVEGNEELPPRTFETTGVCR